MTAQFSYKYPTQVSDSDSMPPSSTMATNTIKLLCWVHGDPSSFPVVIGRDDLIRDLKEAVLVRSPCLQAAGVGRLELCIANIADTKIARNEFVLKDGKEFPGADTIQDLIDDHFQGSLPPRKIHIAIKKLRERSFQCELMYDRRTERINVSMSRSQPPYETLCKAAFENLQFPEGTEASDLSLFLGDKTRLVPGGSFDTLFRGAVPESIAITVTTRQKAFSNWTFNEFTDQFGMVAVSKACRRVCGGNDSERSLLIHEVMKNVVLSYPDAQLRPQLSISGRWFIKEKKKTCWRKFLEEDLGGTRPQGPMGGH
ncbi:hypothetical protein EV426DRAFT_129533 [Tirmania nivea]|nr:hypothetical protein EV426DRAFT_129533 [Tirmania nivea]